MIRQFPFLILDLIDGALLKRDARDLRESLDILDRDDRADDDAPSEKNYSFSYFSSSIPCLPASFSILV